MVSELLGQLAELGRIIKKVKDDSIRSSVRSKAPRLYAKLERAHLKSFIDASDYLFWRRELWDAEKHYNLRMLRAVDNYLSAVLDRLEMGKRDLADTCG